MRLYLDDDMDANMLIRLLQEEGHEVMSPRTVAMRGAEDAAHLQYAAAHQCAVVTANVRDFLTLHQTWQEEGRQHAGILALYRENNPQRDLTYAQIARAISRLARAGLPLQNTFHTLNMGRESSRR
jgi:predicted nuclease of predicted toxin-antitoxin system